MPSQRLNDPRPALLGLYVGVAAARAYSIGMERDVYVDGMIGMDRRDVIMGR